jgi:hypothetical protein
LAQMAQDATQRQAEQNKQMANLQQHVAEGAKKLVDADAQARQELLQLQRERKRPTRPCLAGGAAAGAVGSRDGGRPRGAGRRACCRGDRRRRGGRKPEPWTLPVSVDRWRGCRRWWASRLGRRAETKPAGDEAGRRGGFAWREQGSRAAVRMRATTVAAFRAAKEPAAPGGEDVRGADRR